MSKFLEELESLAEKTESLIEECKAVQGPPVAVATVDIYPTYKHLFNQAAQDILDKPKLSYNSPTTRYFTGRAVGKHNIPKVVEKIAAVINDLSEKGYIVGFLAGLGSIHLNPYPISSMDDHAVYSFPILTIDGAAYVDAAKYDLCSVEGGISGVTISD